MTRERAEEIRRAIWDSHGWDGVETPEERKEIVKVWETMPGWTCFYDAVERIAKGET